MQSDTRQDLVNVTEGSANRSRVLIPSLKPPTIDEVDEHESEYAIYLFGIMHLLVGQNDGTFNHTLFILPFFFLFFSNDDDSILLGVKRNLTEWLGRELSEEDKEDKALMELHRLGGYIVNAVRKDVL